MIRSTLSLLVLLGACTAPSVPAPQPMSKPPSPIASPQSAPADCAVTVSFGSECCGIDRSLYSAITEYAAREPLIVGREEKAWGREGERTLCLATAPGAEGRVFERIKALMSATPERGYTEVTAAGRSHRVASDKP